MSEMSATKPYRLTGERLVGAPAEDLHTLREQEAEERADWQRLALVGLQRADGDDEPDYTGAAITAP